MADESKAVEFSLLFAELHKSGCAKKQTSAGTYVKGIFYQTVNFCEYRGDNCPRLNMPSGTGYELCKASHAEANLAAALSARNLRSDGIAWIAGHYWACEPCAAALKAVGVVEIRVRELLNAIPRAD